MPCRCNSGRPAYVYHAQVGSYLCSECTMERMSVGSERSEEDDESEGARSDSTAGDEKGRRAPDQQDAGDKHIGTKGEGSRLKNNVSAGQEKGSYAECVSKRWTERDSAQEPMTPQD